MTREWLLLMFVLPAKAAPARVQAWRRLQRLGAVLLKNAAYVLPSSPEAREDFEWIRNEVIASGGQAAVLIARAPDQATDDEIVEAFRAARARDFQTLETAAAALLARRRRKPTANKRAFPQALRRVREQFADVARIDFFGTPETERVAGLLARLDVHAREGDTMTTPPSPRLKPGQYRSKVWLTRPRPGVDRMSSAWLIRRFIDPHATFVFADKPARPAAIPFDTFEAEFGHHGPHCTFETLCTRFGITDARALWIGRIVHDLDLKEDRYREPEAATVGQLVEGLRRSVGDDHALLQQGIATFEALYQSRMERSPRSTRKRVKGTKS